MDEHDPTILLLAGPVDFWYRRLDDPLNIRATKLSACGGMVELGSLIGVYHFLGGDQGRYLAGQTLSIDGGRLARDRADVSSISPHKADRADVRRTATMDFLQGTP